MLVNDCIKTPKYICVLGFNVFSSKLDLIPIDENKTSVINTISPNSYGLALKDDVFKQALINSDYLVLDGVYFAFASLISKSKYIKRDQSSDVFYHQRKRINNSLKKILGLERNING